MWQRMGPAAAASSLPRRRRPVPQSRIRCSPSPRSAVRQLVLPPRPSFPVSGVGTVPRPPRNRNLYLGVVMAPKDSSLLSIRLAAPTGGLILPPHAGRHHHLAAGIRDRHRDGPRRHPTKIPANRTFSLALFP